MNTERFKQITSAYLLLFKDGKVLLQRRSGTSFHDGELSVIAGHHDGNCTLKETLAREAMEEAGITIQPQDLRFIHALHKKEGDERLEMFFTTDTWNGTPTINEPDKASELSWFDKYNLPKDTIHYIKQVIDCVNKGEYYSEFGWEKVR